MFLKPRLSWHVEIPAECIDAEGVMLKKAILIRLLRHFATKKASKDFGYFLSVNTLRHVGKGVYREHSGDFLFHVNFSCITFKMFRGEVLEGTVTRVVKTGVLLKCGPVEKIYLAHAKMPGYEFVPGEDPHFMNEEPDMKIGVGTALKFMVLDTRYYESDRDFRAIATLDGEYLGTI